jgi:hypothetical protein
MTTAAEEDPLAEIDRLMHRRLVEERRVAEESAQRASERSEFSTEFERVCNEQVRPAMTTIIERLQRNGGGGIIVERPEDTSRKYAHRLTLWMSLSGEIVTAPRQDRDLYLQLDADAGTRSVLVSEGDLGQGHGGTSGRVGEWKLSEITAALVIQEVLEILRQAVG